MKFLLLIQLLLTVFGLSAQKNCFCSSKYFFPVEKDSLSTSNYGEYSVVDTGYPIVLIFEGNIDNLIEVKRNNQRIFSKKVTTLKRIDVDTNSIFIDSLPKAKKCYKIEVKVYFKKSIKKICFQVNEILPVVYLKRFSKDIWTITATNYMKSYTY